MKLGWITYGVVFFICIVFATSVGEIVERTVLTWGGWFTIFWFLSAIWAIGYFSDKIERFDSDKFNKWLDRKRNEQNKNTK